MLFFVNFFLFNNFINKYNNVKIVFVIVGCVKYELVKCFVINMLFFICEC